MQEHKHAETNEEDDEGKGTETLSDLTALRDAYARILSFARSRHSRYERLSRRRSASKLTIEKRLRNHRRTEVARQTITQGEQLLDQVNFRIEQVKNRT